MSLSHQARPCCLMLFNPVGIQHYLVWNSSRPPTPPASPGYHSNTTRRKPTPLPYYSIYHSRKSNIPRNVVQRSISFITGAFLPFALFQRLQSTLRFNHAWGGGRACTNMYLLLGITHSPSRVFEFPRTSDWGLLKMQGALMRVTVGQRLLFGVGAIWRHSYLESVQAPAEPLRAAPLYISSLRSPLVARLSHPRLKCSRSCKHWEH